MTNWKMALSLVALALCTGMTTITTSNAHADESSDATDEITTPTTSTVSESDEINATPDSEANFIRASFARDDDYNRRSVEDNDGFDDRSFGRDVYRRGYASCYAYCDDIRTGCMRRFYGGPRHRWILGYRSCERRFSDCLETCNDSSGSDR